METHAYDYLIIIHALTTDDNFMNSNSGSKDGNFLLEMKIPHIYSLAWNCYNIKEKKISDEKETLIKYYNYSQLPESARKRSGIPDIEISRKGYSLNDVLKELNAMLFTQYFMQNKSICFVTYGDNLLQKILPHNAKEVGYKLQQHMFTYFDICECFKKFYRTGDDLRKLDDYLKFLKLNPTPLETTFLKMETKTILRIVNKIVNEGFIFSTPKILNPQLQIVTEEIEEKKKPKTFKKWNTFIRSRSPEPFRVPHKGYFIRLRGLPYSARELEIIEFLHGIRVLKEDICVMYDSDGKFYGEAYVRLHNEPDMKEAMSFNLSEFGGRYIEIFETNENEFNKAKYSNRITLPSQIDCPWAGLLQDIYGIVRMRGLPYSSTESDIRDFFKNLRIVQDGVKRTVISGKASSECYVVFESREQASAAMKFNNERIGSRFIELFPATIREFHSWMSVNFGESGPTYSKDQLPNIPTEKRKCTLIVKGLPFSCNKSDLQKFFNDYKVSELDIHLISGHSGKFSGEALVTFEDEMEAERAFKSRNLSYLENRYIELMEYR